MKHPMEWLPELIALPGVSGGEKAVAEMLSAQAAFFGDEVFRDAMGNVIIHRKGTGARVLLAAPMDTPGLLVTHVEENGRLRFGKIGDWPKGGFLGCPMRLSGESRGVLAFERDEEDRRDWADGFLDIGADSREQALEITAPGDRALFEGELVVMGQRVRAPHLSGRLGCAVLLSVLERLAGENVNTDLYIAFLAQSRLGARGAGAAAHAVNPEWALTLDAVPADDGRKTGVRLGAGPVIALTAGRAICAPVMVERLRNAALVSHVACQTAAIEQNAADAGVIQKTGSGVLTGHLGLPVRHLFTPGEVADRRDAAAADLLVGLLTGVCEQES